MRSKALWMLIVSLVLVLQGCGIASQGAQTDAQSASGTFPTPLPLRPTLGAPPPTPTPEALPPLEPRGTVDPGLVVKLETAPGRVELTTADGVKLVGTYYPPTKVKAPALLLLHMSGSDRGVWRDFAMTAQVKGYAALAVDLRGHGESEGSPDFVKMDQDVDVALAWLMGQEKVDPARIGIIGASIGANLALRGGANHPEVKAVALLSPGLDYRGVTTEEALARYGARPLLLVAAEGDDYSADSARQLHKSAEDSARLEVYPGNAHGTNLFALKVNLSDVLFGWLAEALR